MIIGFDSTAIASLFLGHGARREVASLLEQADDIVVSALCRAEVSVALADTASTRALLSQHSDQLGQMWERFWVVPVDQECLDGAADIASQHQLPLSLAVHLAAFDRVERPLHVASLDPRQIPVALSLGFDVIELDGARSAHAMLQPDLPLN